MATLTITKTYEDGVLLMEADLDAIRTSIQTFLNTTKLNDDNFQDDGITASAKIIDASITNAKMADNSVGTTQFQAGSVTAAKLADEAVTDAKLSSSASVDADRAVNTDNIKDGAVTYGKRADLNYILSSSSGSFTTTSTSLVDITNLSVTLTRNGRPTLLALIPDGGVASYIGASNFGSGGGGGYSAYIITQFLKDGTGNLGNFMLSMAGGNSTKIVPPGMYFVIDYSSVVGNSTYSVKMQTFKTSGAFTGSCNNVKLLAMEL